MVFDFLLDIIFPRRCAGCGDPRPNGALCENCRDSLRAHDTLFCGRCRARLPDGKKICHPEHPFVLGAALDYHSGAAGELIKTLKFARNKEVAAYLALFLFEYLLRLPIDISGYELAPVPISAARERERGFNQAELIARELSPLARAPLLLGAILRVKHGKPQSEIRGRKERAENISGAFSAEPSLVAGKNIILLDDVVTSGSTMFEAARVLKAAGAKKIIGLAAAKA